MAYNGAMKKVVVAFDVDGTLIDDQDVPHLPTINLLVILASFKNVEIVVWSGGGQDYAEMWVRRLGLQKFVKRCYDKNHISSVTGTGKVGEHHIFDPPIKPDIAIDDIQDCELGKLNLIVRNK